jgi:hypothetical protein
MKPGSRVSFASIVVLAVMCLPASAEVLNGTPAGPADPTAAVDAWIACRSKPDTGGSCAALRARAIEILREDLANLGLSRAPEDRALLTQALRGPEPELRAGAALAIGMRVPLPAEIPALLGALNDAVPAVRQSVGHALRASEDPRAQAALGRISSKGDGPVAETPLAMGALGVSPYGGASYLFFASSPGEGRAEYATADPVSKVVAFYRAKAAKPPMSLDAFATTYPRGAGGPLFQSNRAGGSGMPDAEQMAQAMAMAQQMAKDVQGMSPEQAQRAIARSAAAQQAPLPTERYSNVALYGSPQVIVLEEAKFMGSTRPSRYVVVFEDKTFGTTGIAVHNLTAP